MRNKVQVQLLLSLVESKTWPGVAKPLVKMCWGADQVPTDLVDDANLFNGGAQIRFADFDGSFHRALSWVDVERIQVISNYGVAGGNKDLARLSEPEHFGDAVSALKYPKYELVREIQEGGVDFGLWFFAVATLAVGMEYHSETIQEQNGVAVWEGVTESVMCCAAWRRL